MKQRVGFTLEYDEGSAQVSELMVAFATNTTVKGARVIAASHLDCSHPSESRASIAAIEYALNNDEGQEFLRCWLHGDFDALRKEWPNVPDTVFIGADPLHLSVNADEE
ncbi:hypothetical protein [Shewanella colwelliana]|uniref:hypothetical protein n=1 Tax=Shewanella colwelliana TaxID=23 RepID=UPI0022AFC53E|nr:hypothetical protein [Shewanella colwelliana]MCZ4337633.1 hypothetical protein [Shewanella colwelliana]